MAKSYQSTLSFPSFFSVDVTSPIDDRLVVDAVEDLTSGTVIQYPYVGMVVNVKNTPSLWVLVDYPATKKENWYEISNQEGALLEGLEGLQTLLESRIEGVQKEIYHVGGGIQSEVHSFQTEIYEFIGGLQTVIQGDINDCHTHCDTEMSGLQKYIEGVQTQVDDDEKKHDKDIAGVQQQIKDAVNKLLDDDGATEIIDSFTEVANWIAGHQLEYNQLLQITNNFIDGFQGDISGLQTMILGVQSEHYVFETSIYEFIGGLQTVIQGDINDCHTHCDNRMNGLQTVIEGVQKQVNNYHDSYDSRMDGLQSFIEGVQKQVSNDEKKHDDDITGVQDQIKSCHDHCDGRMNGLQTVIFDGLQGLQELINETNGKSYDGLQTLILGVQSELHTFETEIYEYIDGVQTIIQGDINDCHMGWQAGLQSVHETITGNKYYVSAVDPSFETDAHGGIPAGLHNTDEMLTKKTFSEMFDMILYPTIKPTTTPPEMTMTYNGKKVSDGDVIVIKVSDRLPLQSAFGGGETRGKVEYIYSDGTSKYVGDFTGVQSSSVTITPGSFNGISEHRKYTVKRTVSYGIGPDLKDNKGNTVPGKYTGGSLFMSIEVHPVYPILVNSNNISNSANINSFAEPDVLLDYTVGDVEYIVNIPSEQSGGSRIGVFALSLPNMLHNASTGPEVYQYNPVSGKYDIPVKMNLSSTTVNLYGVLYNLYVRTTDATQWQGESKYKIVIKQRSY